MGKEWLYWVGSGSEGRSTKKGRIPDVKEASPSGCMCAIFQIFDLRHFHLPLQNQSSHFHPHNSLLQQEDPSVLKGEEAPRNSLELEETPMESLAMKEEENLNITVGIRIKTGRENKSPRGSTSASESRTDYLSSECSNSPGAKTPSLVARLMGLDLLPESTSPSLSSDYRPVTKSQFATRGQTEKRERFRSGACSLPETPRVSLGRRSDVEHRLSLQINKENFCQDFEIQKRGENGNPGHYARQIVKQIKENVSRKFGADISNTITNREIRRDEHLVLLRPRNPSKILTGFDSESMPGKQANSSRILTVDRESRSKRLVNPSRISRGFDCETMPGKQANPSMILTGLGRESRPGAQANPSRNITGFEDEFSPGKQAKPLKNLTGFKNESRPGKQLSLSPELRFLDSKIKSVETCQEISILKGKSSVKKSPRDPDAIRIKKEEPFIRSAKTNLKDKKSKKIAPLSPLSNEFLNINVPTGLLPVKKDSAKIPHKQSQVSDALSSKKTTQLSSCPSPSYYQETFNQENNKQDKRNGAATSGESEHKQYIQKILKRTGIINSNADISSGKWYSPLHFLDPSIFHHLELLDPGTPTRRSNRKLIFQLVDELLVDMLKPSNATQNHRLYGSDLVDELCMKILSFPSADCKVLEDIDALIDIDLCKSSSNGSYEGESESVITEIERRILDSLLHESVRVLRHHAVAYSMRTGSDGCHMGLSRDEMLFVGLGTYV